MTRTLIFTIENGLNCISQKDKNVTNSNQYIEIRLQLPDIIYHAPHAALY